MLSSPFPYFSGGNTELTANHLNLMLEQMRRQSRMLSAPPVVVTQTGSGWQIRLSGYRGLWAVAGRHEGAGRYSWVEAQIGPTGWGPRTGGRTGGGGSAAREANARVDVAAGAIIWLEFDGDRPAFVAPLTAADAPQLVWAEIGEAEFGGYLWSEVSYVGRAFERVTGGRGTNAGDAVAVEANGRDVPAGSIVVVRVADNGQRAVFEYGGSDPGFWAVLLREYRGDVYTVKLESGGTLTFDPGENPAPGTSAGSVTVAADASAEDIEAALRPYTAGHVAVTNTADGFTLTLTGDLAGESGATLSGSALSLTKTQTGRDLPFSDGAGGYAWVRAEFDGFGRLRPQPDGDGSVWPTGLALEADGCPIVPEGTVVRVTPNPTGYMRRANAAARAEFEGWTAEELDDHLAAVDLGDGWLADTGVTFRWAGTASLWAELTDAADENGVYPFRAVHLGGRATVTDPPTEPEELPTAAGLRTARLSPPDGELDTFAVPLSEDDRAWVASRPGGREVTGLAKELFGYAGYAAGTVVRVHVTRAPGGVEFTFSGPPVSFWGTLDGPAEGGGYLWTELEPSPDPLTGEARTPRTGTADEIEGTEGLPAGTAVYLYPATGGRTDRWRFRHQPDTADGDRDCRLLDWQGGSTATIVAGAGDPDSDGRVVTVRFLPSAEATHGVVKGHHVGYRKPGASAYVVTVPCGYHSDRTFGYYSGGAQAIAGSWSLTRGTFVSAGGSESPPFLPPVAFRANCVAGTSEEWQPGWMPVKSDGSLMISGGPKLVATGAALELQGGATINCGTINTIDNFLSELGGPLIVSKDCRSGTVTVGGVAGAANGSITFKDGLYVSSTNPGPRPALYTGSFEMVAPSFGSRWSMQVDNGILVGMTAI